MPHLTSRLIAAVLALVFAAVPGAIRAHNPPQVQAPAAVKPVPPAPLDPATLQRKIDELIDGHMKVNGFSGSVLLAREGKPLVAKGYGYANVEWQIPNAPNTKFRIGSITKQFTSMLVMQLREQGKIKLEDSMCLYVSPCPDTWKPVTIHHLLTHTGGTGDIFGPELTAKRLEIRVHDDYIALYGKRAPAFEPGSRWAYSNYGMVLLGVVIERVSGQSYYDYVAEHIYKPAGMTLSGSPLESDVVPGRAVGYIRQSGKWAPNSPTLGVRGSAAGGGLSTVGDLLKFSEALMANKLLSPENTQLLITGKAGPTGSYAYGFEDGRKNGVGAVGHSGGAPGMNGDLRIYPQSGYVVVVLSNLDPPAAQQVSAYINLRLP